LSTTNPSTTIILDGTSIDTHHTHNSPQFKDDYLPFYLLENL